jgi:hypothetical protein
VSTVNFGFKSGQSGCLEQRGTGLEINKIARQAGGAKPAHNALAGADFRIRAPYLFDGAHSTTHPTIFIIFGIK